MVIQKYLNKITILFSHWKHRKQNRFKVKQRPEVGLRVYSREVDIYKVAFLTESFVVNSGEFEPQIPAIGVWALRLNISSHSDTT